MEEEYHDLVIDFKKSFERRSEVVKYVKLPFVMDYPIPDIKTEEELLIRYKEVFDPRITGLVIRSSLRRDWKAKGTRGITMKNGMLWLDYNGKVIKINHQTKLGKRKKQKIIQQSKRLLHSSIRKFVSPVTTWKTRNFKIRIDKMGGNKFRYVAWANSKERIDKPTLILRNGKASKGGAGVFYVFKTDTYIYKCFLKAIKSSREAPGDLRVFKKSRLILHEKAIKVIKP
ncbi:MAG: hypothetical protein GY714_06835 [Desulfobacterales bacterium]|nr:hypothetical protein [Desulfobacterales bacterium]MCP4159939.1 hypothetical protein [Deltaproteobacteria bacterium]